MSCATAPATIDFKRGDTFVALCVRRDSAGVAVDLTTVNIASQVRTEDGGAVSTCTVTKADQITNPGEFELRVSDTTAWPLKRLVWDIQYTVDGQVQSDPTVFIRVQRDVTQ